MLLRVFALCGVVLLSSYAYAESDPTTVDGVADWDADGIEAIKGKKGYTFRAGKSWVTRHLQKTKDIRSITGFLGQAGQDSTPGVYIEPLEDLPESLDLRKITPGGLQPVRNQGRCGSCWAFSTTAVLESLAIIANPTGPRHDLSEQQVLSCSRAGSCRGGYFTAFNYLKKGVGQEEDFKYQARDLRCKEPETKEKLATWSYIKGKNGGEPSVEQLKTALLTYGPLSVTVNGSFSSYKSGVYNRCSRGSTNHMVTLEGWDDATKSWVMRNSWGSSWGQKGYMNIAWTDSMGRKCNRIGEVAAFAVLPEDI